MADWEVGKTDVEPTKAEDDEWEVGSTAVQTSSFVDRLHNAAAQGIAESGPVRHAAEKDLNKAAAIERAINEAKARGNVAGFAPYNRPIADLEKELAALKETGNKAMSEYKALRAEIDAGRGTTGNKVVDFGADLLGGLSAAGAQPSNFVFPAGGVGKNLLGTVARGFGANAAAGGVTSMYGQQEDVKLGIRKETSIKEAFESALVSGVFGGLIHGVVNRKGHLSTDIPIDVKEIYVKAAAIAKSQGRDKVTPDDLKAAEAGFEPPPKMPTDQQELQLDNLPRNEDQARAWAAEREAAAREAAQGEVQTMLEAQTFLDEQYGKRDLFNESPEATAAQAAAAKELQLKREIERSTLPYDPTSGELPPVPKNEPPAGRMSAIEPDGLELEKRRLWLEGQNRLPKDEIGQRGIADTEPLSIALDREAAPQGGGLPLEREGFQQGLFPEEKVTPSGKAIDYTVEGAPRIDTSIPYVAERGMEADKGLFDYSKKTATPENRFVEDIPNESWLKGKVDYAVSRGRDSNGAPFFGVVTGYFKNPVQMKVSELAKLKGLNLEQFNVRENDLAGIKESMRRTGKLPLTESGKEHVPFITVAHNGEAWVNEGNHRIMAAQALGWDTMPVEVRYFDGGQRNATGMFSPNSPEARFSAAVSNIVDTLTHNSKAMMLPEQRTPILKSLSEAISAAMEIVGNKYGPVLRHVKEQLGKHWESVKGEFKKAYDEASSKASFTRAESQMNERLAKHTIRGDFRGALQEIVDSSESIWNRRIADYLLKDTKFDIKLHTPDFIPKEQANGMANARGLYDPHTGIYLSKNMYGHINEATLIHEAMHAHLVRFLDMYKNGLPIPNKRVADAVQSLHELYRYVDDQIKNDPKAKAQYGMTDVHEFVSEAFSNPHFQKFLADMVIKNPKSQGLVRTVTSALHALASSIARIFGIPPTKENINVLTKTISEGMAVIDELKAGSDKFRNVAYGGSAASARSALNWAPESVSKPHAQKAEVRKPDSYEDFLKRELAGQPKPFIDRFGKMMYEEYKKAFEKENGPRQQVAGFDNRPFEEFKDDLFRKDGTQRDSDNTIAGLQGVAYTVARKSKVIRRVYDQITQASTAIDNKFNEYMRGAKIETSGVGISAAKHGKLVESPDSLAYLSARMSQKDVDHVMDLIGKYKVSDPAKLFDEAFLRSTGASENTFKFFRALKKFGEDTLKDINDINAKAGRALIAARPDWVLSQARPGKYHVYSIGKDGKSEFRAGFADKAEALKVQQYMQEKHGVRTTVAEAFGDPRRMTLPPEAFFEAMKTAENAAERKAMQEAFQDAIDRTGVRKYGMARDSVAGGASGDMVITEALGSKAAFEHMMYGLKAYANATASYVGGFEFGKRVNETVLDPQIREFYPNDTYMAEKMFDTFRGVDRPVNHLVESLVQGPNRAFTAANIVMLNPVFYAANTMQFSFIPAKMLELKSTQLGGKGDVTGSMLKALNRLYIERNTPETKAIIQEATRNGSLQPKFAEALEWKMSEGPFTNAAKTATGEKLAAMSDSFSRAAAYLMLYEQGISAGMKSKEAHSFAARESQGAMIQYERWARMPVFNKLGAAGDLLSPLTSFVSNMAFNIGNYMKMSVGADKSAVGMVVGPLLAYITAQTALAGVKGLPGYQDLDEGVAKLNELYVKNFGGKWFGTPSDWMNEAGVPQVLQWGVPSYLSGVNMTGTLGMGQLLPNFATEKDITKMAPGVDFAVKAAHTAVTTSMTDLGLMDTTKAEYQQALKQVAPGMSKEWIRQYYDGENVRDSKGDLLYTRDWKQNMAAMLTGKAPLEEANLKRVKYQMQLREGAEKQAKTKAVALITDALEAGKPLDPTSIKTLTNYPEMGTELPKSIQKKLLDRNIPWEVRKMIEAKNKANTSSVRTLNTLEGLYAE